MTDVDTIAIVEVWEAILQGTESVVLVIVIQSERCCGEGSAVVRCLNVVLRTLRAARGDGGDEPLLGEAAGVVANASPGAKVCALLKFALKKLLQLTFGVGLYLADMASDLHLMVSLFETDTEQTVTWAYMTAAFFGLQFFAAWLGVLLYFYNSHGVFKPKGAPRPGGQQKDIPLSEAFAGGVFFKDVYEEDESGEYVMMRGEYVRLGISSPPPSPPPVEEPPSPLLLQDRKDEEERGITPELLTLTHESLSMRWAAPPGGASNYVVELAEGEDGVVDDDEEWAVIYEGAPPGCEISYLTAETEYHMRVAYTDHTGRTR